MKTELIEEILRSSSGADATWLLGFDEAQLATYLERLRYLEQPRGQSWQRRDETPAVVCRTAA